MANKKMSDIQRSIADTKYQVAIFRLQLGMSVSIVSFFVSIASFPLLFRPPHG
jgi:hypothetical protein